MPIFGPTTDHKEIRRWAALNNAVPVRISTLVFDGEPAKVGFRFLNGSRGEPEFTPITWESFFALFDVLELSFVYDEASPASYELLQSDQKLATGFSAGAS